MINQLVRTFIGQQYYEIDLLNFFDFPTIR